jgi:hypothetical protein
MGAMGGGPGPKPKVRRFEKVLAWISGLVVLIGALDIALMAIDQYFGTSWSYIALSPLMVSLGGILAWGLLIGIMWWYGLRNGWTSVCTSLLVIAIVATMLGIYWVSLILAALIFGVFAYGFVFK